MNYPTRFANPTSLDWVALELARGPQELCFSGRICFSQTGVDNVLPFCSSWPPRQKGEEMFRVCIPLYVYTYLYIDTQNKFIILQKYYPIFTASQMLGLCWPKALSISYDKMNKRWTVMKTFQLIVNTRDIFSVFQDEKLSKLLNYICPCTKKASRKRQGKGWHC